jgi:hypothetical protein
MKIFKVNSISFFSFIFLTLKSEWHNSQNRRKFFENYAKEHGFDPLIPENWNSTTRESVKSMQVLFHFCFILNKPSNLFIEGGARVLACHNGKVSQALIELFGMKRENFQSKF